MNPGILEIVLIVTAACLVNAQTFNDTCSTDANCNAAAILKCDTATSKCVCQKPDEQIFDQNKQACVARVGYACDHDEDDGLHCVEGGYCYAHNTEAGHVHECACNLGFEPTPDLFCRSATGYDDECSSDADCSTDAILKCDTVARKCVCQKPDEQVFDQNKQACVARVGYGCDHDEDDGVHCIEGGYCYAHNTEEGHVHECACKLGWVPTSDLFCESPTGYDDDCSEETDCNSSKFLKCDPTTKKCVCQNPIEQIFDQSKQSCVARVGYACDHDGTLQCVSGAYCDMPVIDGVMQHRCKCNDGWTVTEEMTCSGANVLFQMATSFLLLAAAFIGNRIL